MITTQEIKIKRTDNFNSKYVEDELLKTKLDVLRWVIVDFDDNYFTLNLVVAKD